MNKKGFVNIAVIIIFVVIILAGVVYFWLEKEMTSITDPSIVACTEDAMQCPDGSYVGRSGKNCEFVCPRVNPSVVMECTKDSDCPSSKYICQEIQGMGTACPSNDPACVPNNTIVQGECKLKEGNRCGQDSDCAGGNLCHKNICVSPILGECSGPNDTSCPSNYECRQGCGSPVGYQNEPPPPYFCELAGYVHTCPICLAENTLIDTPNGEISVQKLEKGMSVWTVNKIGERVSGIVIETGKTRVPSTHKVIHLILDDGREIFVSPGHPTTDNRIIGDLAVGDMLNERNILTIELIPYKTDFTYDILISGETGFYFANGILLDSTLH